MRVAKDETRDALIFSILLCGECECVTSVNGNHSSIAFSRFSHNSFGGTILDSLMTSVLLLVTTTMATTVKSFQLSSYSVANASTPQYTRSYEVVETRFLPSSDARRRSLCACVLCILYTLRAILFSSCDHQIELLLLLNDQAAAMYAIRMRLVWLWPPPPAVNASKSRKRPLERNLVDFIRFARSDFNVTQIRFSLLRLRLLLLLLLLWHRHRLLSTFERQCDAKKRINSKME